MSRAYRIRVSESVTRTVHIEDGLSFRLELLDVVGAERTTALLRQGLLDAGFETGEDGRARRTKDGIEVIVDASTGEVEVRQDAEATITKEGSLSRAVVSRERGEAVAKAGLETKLDAQVHAEAEALRVRITAELERHVPGIQSELNRIANTVVATALEERARELGDIEEIQRDEATGELLIRVRV